MTAALRVVKVWVCSCCRREWATYGEVPRGWAL